MSNKDIWDIVVEIFKSEIYKIADNFIIYNNRGYGTRARGSEWEFKVFFVFQGQNYKFRIIKRRSLQNLYLYEYKLYYDTATLNESSIDAMDIYDCLVKLSRDCKLIKLFDE
jgi:hypothetical protein